MPESLDSVVTHGVGRRILSILDRNPVHPVKKEDFRVPHSANRHVARKSLGSFVCVNRARTISIGIVPPRRISS